MGVCAGRLWLTQPCPLNFVEQGSPVLPHAGCLAGVCRHVNVLQMEL